jgi:hypothetical protein
VSLASGYTSIRITICQPALTAFWTSLISTMAIQTGRRRSPDRTPSIFANDVIITKKTYKGKELVVIEEDEDPDSPFVHKGPFRLMDLPAELRMYIYSFLMPYNMVIKHEQAAFPRVRRQLPVRGQESVPQWCIDVEPKNKQDEPEAEPPIRGVKYPAVPFGPNNYARMAYTGPMHAKCNLGVERQLFLVNKAVSNEALSKSIPLLTVCPFNQPTVLRCPLRLKHLPLHRLRQITHPIHAIPADLWPLRHRPTPAPPAQPEEHSDPRTPRRPRPLGRQAPTRPSRVLHLHPKTAL